MRPFWYPSWGKIAGVGVGGILGALLLFGVAYAMIDVPDLNEGVAEQSTVIKYRDGTEIGRIGEFNRRKVPLHEVPQHVQHAVLAAENRTFYSDAGISPIAITRAFINNVRGGSTQGGSTITQQYAKIAHLSQEQTLTRKIKEAFIAIKIDRRYTKDQILENYLNAIYFGRGAYGIQAASEAYFKKPVGQLTVSQGAVLASIIKYPSTDPRENRDLVEPRWEYVLDGMVESGWLDKDEALRAKFPKVAKYVEESQLGGPEGYLLAATRQELERKFSEDAINRSGLVVTTTFDRKAQRAAIQAVRQEKPRRPKDLHAGLAAVEPRTGETLAIYGGDDYVEQPFNDAIQAHAQAGSTFKPFALTAALEDGIGLKSRFNGADDRRFPQYRERPVGNFGDENYGVIDLIKATESSVNTVYFALGIKVGHKDVVDVARRAGIPNDVPITANSSVPLGPASPSALDLAGAYATFAAQGEQADPYIVEKVETSEGGTPFEHQAEPPQRVFQRDVMADLGYALQQVVEDGSGFEALQLGRPSAGKTGTSQNNLSAWYAGYTPQLAAAVDMFRGDGTEPLKGIGEFPPGVGMTGGSYPARIWTAFMQGALEGRPIQDFPPPEWVGRTVNPKPTFTPTPTPTDTITPSPTPTETFTPSPTRPPPSPPETSEPPPGWPAEPDPSDSESPSPTNTFPFARGNKAPGG